MLTPFGNGYVNYKTISTAVGDTGIPNGYDYNALWPKYGSLTEEERT